ncbi:MFS general substrate transporter [Hypoxylon cercidicola]|nr:MFS general substrate transporter [Hypoxylon cercidicola]
MGEQQFGSRPAENGSIQLATVTISESPTNTKKPFSFYMSILGLGLLSLITSWDSTSLAIALPVITRELHGTTLESFWASISFILGVAVTQPIYVNVSDILGRKLPLYTSMVLFAIGAVVFAVAHDMPVLIVGRLIQGLGAGGLDVLEEIILADITNLKERPLYIGVLAVAIAAGTISGPVIGAVFSEFVDWRWIGWINLPFVVIAFVLAFFFLRLRNIPQSISVKVRGLDWVGMALFAVGTCAAALPLSWADSLYPWSSWRTIVPLAIGVIVLAIFCFYEKRAADKGVTNTILPYRVFANTTSVLSLATGFIHGLIMYTMLLYLPLFFQAVFLEAPLDAAKTILPVCALVVAFSLFAPITIEITRRYRVLLWVGWLVTTLFLGLWCLIAQNTSRTEVYVFQVLIGAGTGILFTGTQVPMQASVVDVNDTGLAVGMLVVFRLFGALVGLAISSTAFSSVFQRSIAALGTLPEQVRVLNDPSQAVGFIPSLRTLDLPSEYMITLVEAYRKPFLAIWIIITCLSGIGLFLSFFIKELSLESEDVGRQGFDYAS